PCIEARPDNSNVEMRQTSPVQPSSEMRVGERGSRRDHASSVGGRRSRRQGQRSKVSQSVGSADDLRSVSNIQLFHDPTDVHFDGALAQSHLVRYYFVGFAHLQSIEYSQFATSELIT